MTDVLLFTESTGQAIEHPWGGWRGMFHVHQWETLSAPWNPVGRTHRPDFPAWGHYEAIPNGTAAAALADLDNVFSALARLPDLVIVSLGINDGVEAGFQWPEQPNTYTMVQPMTDLLVCIDERAPGVPIVVTTIPVCVQTPEQVTWTSLWNRYLPRGANEARKAGARIWVADIWAQVNENRKPSTQTVSGNVNSWLADGIHPNDEGYVRAAQDAGAWFDAHRLELGL